MTISCKTTLSDVKITQSKTYNKKGQQQNTINKDMQNHFAGDLFAMY